LSGRTFAFKDVRADRFLDLDLDKREFRQVARSDSPTDSSASARQGR
jgi:hypothetical protein